MGQTNIAETIHEIRDSDHSFKNIHTFTHHKICPVDITSVVLVHCHHSGGLSKTDVREKRLDIICNIQCHRLVDKTVPLMRISHSKQIVLGEKGPQFVFELEAFIDRTPFKRPFLIVTVGLSKMKVPSTTGTNTYVPKNPLRLML